MYIEYIPYIGMYSYQLLYLALTPWTQGGAGVLT